MYYVYILRCEDNSLYTGIASDVKRRFFEHCAGGKLAAKYTKSHKPKHIEIVWCVETKSQALRVEAYIKKSSRQTKEQLIFEPEKLDAVFPKNDSDSVINALKKYCKYNKTSSD